MKQQDWDFSQSCLLFIFIHSIDTEYESVVKYWYENGLVIKAEDVTNNAITISFEKTPQYTSYYANDENSSSQTLKQDDLTIFDAGITYDEASNSFVKSYNKLVDADAENLASFLYVYDENGNIAEDGNNHYTYDDLGELIETTGLVNSSYTYDNRGNMTSKTVDGETTTFSYDPVWWDQLIAVNGEALTYDVNGNLTSYGEKSYEWSNGKQLSQVTDGENTYSYRYDENGIRYEKNINGESVKINTLNGRVVAQKTTSKSYNVLSTLYFQYDNKGVPFGFVYDYTQYFYITNLSGDIVGITNSNGELIAEYTYDEWGKLLSITTAEEGNEKQQEIAELNPLRYRGYYYDSETGYYYLQSRYYDPEIGRFISADGFEYLDTSNRLNANAYIYCWNCPTAFEDVEGTTPKLSIDKQTVLDFLSSASSLKTDIATGLEKLYNDISTSFQSLQSVFCAPIEKLKFYYMNPGELSSEFLSKLLGRDIHIEYKMLKELRCGFVSLLQNAKELFKNPSDKNSNEEDGIVAFSSESNDKEDNNIVMAIVQGLLGGIVIKAISDMFDAIKISLEDIFNQSLKHGWDGLFKELMYTGVAIFSAGYVELKDLFSFEKMFENGSFLLSDWLVNSTEKAGDLAEASNGKAFFGFFSLFGIGLSFKDKIENSGTGVFSKNTDIILSVISLAFDILSLFIKIPFVDVLVSSAGVIFPKIVAMRIGGLVVC